MESQFYIKRNLVEEYVAYINVHTGINRYRKNNDMFRMMAK
jgi:hypothetical protein